MPRINLQSINWLSPDNSVAVEHEVRGTLQNFYPLSPLVLPKFQETFKAVASGIREYSYNAREEAGTQMIEDSRSNHVRSETTLVPLSVEMSQEHAKRRRATLDEMVNALVDEKQMYVIGLCILDSMRDTFEREPGKPFTEKDAKEFVEQLDFPDFVAMAIGVFRANVDSFGPVGKRLARKAEKAIEGVLDEHSNLSLVQDETSEE